MANEAEAGKQLAADNAAALAKYKTATAEPAPTTPSNEAMPTGDIYRSDGSMVWKHVFADDFTTNANEGEFLTKYGSKFAAYPTTYKDTWTQGHPERNGRYDPNIISVSDSQMHYNMRHQDGMFKVAATLPILPGKKYGTGWTEGHLYYRIAIRVKAEPMYGFKTAFLTWPTSIASGQSSAWPWNGEIDFYEGNLDGASKMGLFMHRQNATSNHDQDYREYGATSKEYHVYTLDWNDKYCAVYLDGKMIGTPITSRVPNNPHKIVLQAETNLDGRQQPSTSTKGRVSVDWVSVWVRP